jgi:hypothetical protein
MGMGKLCESISDSSGRVKVKDRYTFNSNFDYKILQWNGSAPKKDSECFMLFVNPCIQSLI